MILASFDGSATLSLPSAGLFAPADMLCNITSGRWLLKIWEALLALMLGGVILSLNRPFAQGC